MCCLLMCNLSLSFGSIWHCAPAIRSMATLNLLILCSSTLKIISRRPLCLWGAIKQDLRWTFYHNLPTTVTAAEWERLYEKKVKESPETNRNDYEALILVVLIFSILKKQFVILRKISTCTEHILNCRLQIDNAKGCKVVLAISFL